MNGYLHEEQFNERYHMQSDKVICLLNLGIVGNRSLSLGAHPQICKNKKKQTKNQVVAQLLMV